MPESRVSIKQIEKTLVITEDTDLYIWQVARRRIVDVAQEIVLEAFPSATVEIQGIYEDNVLESMTSLERYDADIAFRLQFSFSDNNALKFKLDPRVLQNLQVELAPL